MPARTGLPWIYVILFVKSRARRRMKSKYRGCHNDPDRRPSDFSLSVVCRLKCCMNAIMPSRYGLARRCTWSGMMTYPNKRTPRLRSATRTSTTRSRSAGVSGVTPFARFVVMKKIRSRSAMRRRRLTRGFYSDPLGDTCGNWSGPLLDRRTAGATKFGSYLRYRRPSLHAS